MSSEIPSNDETVPVPDGQDPAANGQNPPTEKKGPPRGPRVFGRFAWAITVPFIIYWAGTAFAAYLENVRDGTRLVNARRGLMVAVDRVNAELASMPEGTRADWEQYLNWERFQEVVQDPEHSMTIEDYREVGKVLYSEYRPGLNEEPFLSLRNRFEEFLVFWEKQEARKHGLDPSRKHYEPLVPGGRTEEEIQVSSEIQRLLDEDANSESIYPSFYTGVAIATFISILIVFPLYLKIPLRMSALSVAVGAVGFVAWVGLVWVDHTFIGLGQMLARSGRAAFDPVQELGDTSTWMYVFIGIRLFGLALLVPIAEEFFLRGWLMRYIDHPDWDEIPIGYAGKLAIYGSVIYGVVAHLGEPLAALVWFSMMTWLYLRTKNIWECVVAHGVTNLLLGIYVLATHTWSLW